MWYNTFVYMGWVPKCFGLRLGQGHSDLQRAGWGSCGAYSMLTVGALRGLCCTRLRAGADRDEERHIASKL